MIRNDVTTISLSKKSSVYPPKPVAMTTKAGSRSGQDETKYKVVLTWEGVSSLYSYWDSTSSDKVTSRTLPTVSFLLEGNKGSSDVTTIDLKKVKQLNGKSISNLEVGIKLSFLPIS